MITDLIDQILESRLEPEPRPLRKIGPPLRRFILGYSVQQQEILNLPEDPVKSMNG